MIDGKELRFGNLFYWSDPEMDERKGKRTVGIIKSSNIGDSEFMDAIPLTEEWLKKLGFLRERDILGLSDTWWKKGLGLNHIIGNRFSVKTPYKTGTVLLVHEVHELQNLFYALQNKQELEVKP